jgi:glycine/D-amino acid oxidase-like deaminating enzyme
MPTKPRYGDSPWIYGFPDARRPNHPGLRGEHQSDVVIIGAGLTGAATAQACAAAGIRTLVLEADRVGEGGSGRSAGLLLPEPGPAFRAVVEAHGLRTARAMFELWRKATLEAAALLRRSGVQCGLAPLDAVTLTHEEKPVRREFDARIAAGLPLQWLTDKQVRTRLQATAAAATRSADAFSLDPFRATLGLALAARKRGAKFAERTAVRKVKFGKDGVEITTDSAVVRAATAIVTTGTATAEFMPLRRHFTRREKYLVMTEPVPAAARKQVFPPTITLGDTHVPAHRVRWTADHRLVIAGGDQAETPARTRGATLVAQTNELMYEFLTMYPAILGLRAEFGWAMPYGETADGLMYIGTHRNYPHHLFALGGSSESVTGSFLAARILARAAAGAPAKGDDLFGWAR